MISTDNGYFRKCIHIKATDSPNVRRALLQQEKGIKPDGRTIVPGILPWDEYQKRLKLLDPHKRCVSLDGEWYEGSDLVLYPPEWLGLSAIYATQMRLYGQRQGSSMGVDSAMGGDNTAWAIVNQHGLIHLESIKTPDTTQIVSNTAKLIREYGIPSDKVIFDGGGGGKPHADRLRKMGYNCRVVWFGEGVKQERRRGVTVFSERVEIDETRYSYRNRRAQMYGLLRILLEPEVADDGTTLLSRFGIPQQLAVKSRPDGKSSLRDQLRAVPYLLDEEGRLRMLPKNNPDPEDEKKDTLTKRIGCSPDEMDALVLAVYGRQLKSVHRTAGAV